MGMALAYRLVGDGHQVHVIERESQLGGLATWYDFGGFDWDRFYHVILPTDLELIQFVNDIGLGEKLRWQETQTGFYVDQKFHSLNDTLDFIKFPPLSIWGKFRLALTILYCARINNWRRLEKILVEDWLIRVSGRSTYEKMWKPLLLAKLGENYKRVSAVFIWSYIKRLFSARDSSAQKEQMGHVSGGYKAVFQRLVECINARGGVIHCGSNVQKISADKNAGIWLERDYKREHFDKIVFTSPVNILRNICDPELVKIENDQRDVEYLGVICMVLITHKPIVPYYVLNIADQRIPFTGVVGMSTVVDPKETAGRHVTYFPKYVLSTDPLLGAKEAELRETFMRGARLMFPDYDWSAVESIHINRAIKVQPLQVLDYSTLVPRCVTEHPDFFVLNTSQFVNNTLNNNAVIHSVNEFWSQYRHRLTEEADRSVDLSEIKSASA